MGQSPHSQGWGSCAVAVAVVVIVAVVIVAVVVAAAIVVIVLLSLSVRLVPLTFTPAIPPPPLLPRNASLTLEACSIVNSR